MPMTMAEAIATTATIWVSRSMRLVTASVCP